MECGQRSELDVNEAAHLAWRHGALIQDAFPGLSPDERELLMTGTHPACWDAMFPEEEGEEL